LGLDSDGICLGGFSVGELKELTWEVLEASTACLPEGRPRYLMGMGSAGDLWDAVARGVDMMDCVWPSRNARNARVLLRNGWLNITKAEFRMDFRPIEEGCPCPVCRRYSRAYLCHLFRGRELSAYRLATLHTALHLGAHAGDTGRDPAREVRGRPPGVFGGGGPALSQSKTTAWASRTLRGNPVRRKRSATLGAVE
jgi:tRNA-guanine family transglycosylase